MKINSLPVKPYINKSYRTQFPKLLENNLKDFISFSSNSIAVLDKGNLVPDELISEAKNSIKQIEEGKLEIIGEGKFGVVYKANDRFVVKEQKLDDDFNQESSILKLIPEDFTNTPKLIARLRKDNKVYLVSSFVEGSFIHPDYNPLTPKHITGILSDLFKLDKAGIMHDDLAMYKGNVLADSERVKILDFGCSYPFTLNDRTWNCPDFLVPSNSIDFEERTLVDYMSEMTKNYSQTEINSFFKDYLIKKSQYHDDRAKYFENNADLTQSKNRDAIDYEKLEAKFLKKPSDGVIGVEGLKIKISYYNRQADNHKPNPILTLYYRVLALNSVVKLKDKAEKLKNEKVNDKDFVRYLDYQKKYADFWTKNLFNWALGDLNNEISRIFPNRFFKNPETFIPTD